MKKLAIIGILVMVFLGVTSLSRADSIDDMVGMGYLSIHNDKESSMVSIEPQLYNQMTYVQKLGLCKMVMDKYGTSKVYGFKMGTHKMLFAFDWHNGMRVY